MNTKEEARRCEAQRKATGEAAVDAVVEEWLAAWAASEEEFEAAATQYKAAYKVRATARKAADKVCEASIRKL